MRRLEPAATLRVHEVYASIQGESTWAGMPCAFVRLTGCNLRCSWCDTTQAFHGGTERTVAEVAAEALGHYTPVIEVTGGEPLLQAGCMPLLSALADSGETVLLETGGGVRIDGVDPRVHIILDIKCPGSGMSDRNIWGNLNRLREGRDEVKFVLADRADYEWMRDQVDDMALRHLGCPLLASPVHGVLDPRELVSWVIADRLPVRVNLQLHKYVWGPEVQSV